MGVQERGANTWAQESRAFLLAARRSIFRVGGKADHFTRYGSTQWGLCTSETYQELTEKFNLSGEGFREQAYEEYRPTPIYTQPRPKSQQRMAK